jgi:DNA-binding IclR family transcriptional regulator
MGPKGLRSFVDAIQVVSLRGSVTVREMCEVLDIPRSTAHRLVASLLEVGFIKREDSPGRYSIGPLLGELGGDPLAWRALTKCCRPHMEALRDFSGETVAIHVLHAERRVQLEQAESNHEHCWVSKNTLVPMPLHAGAAAKMLLALMPRDDVGRLMERDGLEVFTGRTPGNIAALLRELGRIGIQRYAISVEEVTPGIASIAVPVVSEPSTLGPLTVMSLTGPIVRLTETQLKRFLPKLQQAASRSLNGLSQGYRGHKRIA